MADLRTWYLIIQALAPSGLPVPAVPDQVIGPMSGTECGRVKHLLGPIPKTVTAHCWRTGMRLATKPQTGEAS